MGRERRTKRTGRKERARRVPCPWARLEGIHGEQTRRRRVRCTRYAPGWPELALPTVSTARVRMVAMAVASEGWGVKADMVVWEERGERGGLLVKETRR